jgi:hypothetical protein
LEKAMTTQAQILISMATRSAEFPANFRTVASVGTIDGLCSYRAIRAGGFLIQQNGSEKGAA